MPCNQQHCRRPVGGGANAVMSASGTMMSSLQSVVIGKASNEELGK